MADRNDDVSNRGTTGSVGKEGDTARSGNVDSGSGMSGSSSGAGNLGSRTDRGNQNDEDIGSSATRGGGVDSQHGDGSSSDDRSQR